MTEEVFRSSLEFSARTEKDAWTAGALPLMCLSGGECTEHPEIVEFVRLVIGQGCVPMLITNGMWLGNRDLRESLLRREWHVLVQVTHDPRFYPRQPPFFNDRRVVYVDKLSNLVPLGRAARRTELTSSGVPWRLGPTSFNLRSAARSLRSFAAAVCYLRLKGTQCTPIVTETGDVLAGETRTCYRIGDVQSSERELTQALCDMQCDRCGLTGNLTLEQRQAIGVSV